MKGIRGGGRWGLSVAAIAAALGVAACSGSGSGDSCSSCSLECGCALDPAATGRAGMGCNPVRTMSDACALARAHDFPGDPDASRASRREGCGYVSYMIGNGIAGWDFHYDAATGELVGLEAYNDVEVGIPCEQLISNAQARYGFVPDWDSCHQTSHCGLFGGSEICDWDALCGP